MPNQITVEDFQPSRNQTLSADTTVTWTPSDVAGNSVYMSSFDFPASERVVDLRCRMNDDGNFTLPENVIVRLDETLGAGWSLEGIKQDQSAARVVIQGDALLVVSKSRDTLF